MSINIFLSDYSLVWNECKKIWIKDMLPRYILDGIHILFDSIIIPYTLIFLVLFLRRVCINHPIWKKCFLSCVIMTVICGVCVFVWYSREDNKKLLLCKDKEFADMRLRKVRELLFAYNISSYSRLLLLIERVEKAQKEYDPIQQYEKLFKYLTGVFVPVLSYAITMVSHNFSIENLIKFAIVVVALWSILSTVFWILSQIIKEIIFPEYQIYRYLLSDLRDISVFYQPEETVQ